MHSDNDFIGFRDLFLKVSAVDIILMTIGTISSATMGILQPLLFLLIANMIGGLSPDHTREEYYENALETSLYMLYLGFSFIICGFFAVSCWIRVGARQSYKYRMKLFKKFLKLEPEWFEQTELSEISSTTINDFIKVERATGDKIVIILFTFSMFVTSLVISFFSNVKLALIVLPIGFLMTLGFYIANKGLEESSKITPLAYKEASGIAEEALQEVKTVSALNAQNSIALKFSQLLSSSKKSMVAIGIKIGGGIGFGSLMLGVMTGTVFLVGAYELENENEDWLTGDSIARRDIILIHNCFGYVFYNIATLIPCFQAVNQGKQAAARIFKILNYPVPSKRECMKQIEGGVSFNDVCFSYPSLPENLVLKNISFRVCPGDRLGITGATGSGKSTIVALLLKFFDPSIGGILIDDIPISDFNIKHLRKYITYVGQEPLLFNTSIQNNIQFGDLNADSNQIIKAAKFAEAYDFTEELPEKWETIVGTKGSHLSGGQKQRIVIARSILRNPKILILDESTSALDRNTESQVLSNLDNALKDCTRISIAQNLLTIRDSTNIILLSEGRIIEEGSHQELMKQHGSYYNLVKMQQKSTKKLIEDKLSSAEVYSSQSTNLQTVEDDKSTNYIKEILKLNKSDKLIAAVAILGCVVTGVASPFIGMGGGLLISNIGIMEGQELIDETTEKMIWLLVLSLLLLLGQVSQFLTIPRLSANITTQMRESSLRAMLNFDACFFDDPQNNSSALSSRLSKDCEDINAIGESMIGLIVGNIVVALATVSVSAYFSWRLSLVCLAILPLLFFFMISVFFAQMKGIVKLSYEKNGELLSDFILNYKSVKALNLQKYTLQKFQDIAERDHKSTNSKAFFAGLTYGAGFGVFVFMDVLIYWYGAKLYRDEEISFQEMIVSIYVVLIGISGFMLVGVHSGDIGGAMKSAKNIFRILRLKPSIDIQNKGGLTHSFRGEIEFQEVSFSYSNRDSYALKNVSFRVEAGSKCAIIGTTGSGKSTISQLLIRLYDPSNGIISIDSIDIKRFQLKYLRTQIGMVSQEPVLFSGSIYSNIALGIEKQREEIEEAAEQAQAMEFIVRHKKRFDRQVGFKGSKLSGGQKQRIAIARCLVRRPQIVVLDEATSALDSNTERSVLNSLFGCLKESTFIIIAHRLKTIEPADQIVVLESGRVLETGSKESLLEQKGYFYNLIKNLE